MDDLRLYISAHTDRGECQCGKCIDKGPDESLGSHTVDLIFFEVCLRDKPDADFLRTMIQANVEGSHCNVDLFDGEEHSYLELGSWIGDQGLAMLLMGMGSLLGLWKRLTPKTIFGSMLDDETVTKMAGMGMVAIQHTP